MEPYKSPFEPLNLLVVVRRAPRLVAPASETPRTVLYLPVTNAFVGFGSILSSHMLLFEAKQYPAGYGFDGGEVRNPCHGIARGLEKVLVPYYPLAGRLRPGAERGKLELVCNSQGAVFVEAQANISLAELKRLDKVYWSELQYDFVPEASTEIPPLVIQVTMLSCGGFVVSIRVLQSLCDSAGMLHFLHAWSELTKSRDNFISTTPIWGAALPKQVAEWPQKFNFPSLDLAHEEVESMAHKQYMEAQNQAYYENVTGLSNVSISLEELSSLKEAIRIKCNRFEALAALFWRERTRALGLPPQSEVILFFPAPVAHDVNMAFYGQYAFNCMAATTAGNLVQSELTEIVRFLHDSKASLEENFTHVVKEFAKLHCPAKRAPPPHVFLFTLLWDGVAEIDFGWGTAPHAPDAVRLHSPVNVAAITGGLEDTVEIVMTNAPLTMAEKISLHLRPSRSFLKSDSRL